ncbi:MAG: phosphatase PAP2 family protein [Gammaproteobacteria bacterium]
MIVVLLCTGCSTLPSGRGWGGEATLTPSWSRVGTAAREAASDPWVWAPLVGAALVQIDDWDRRAAAWACRHTPVFGSQSDAERWSDDLRDASAALHYVTIAVMPSGQTAGEWLLNKARGTLVQVAAVSATANLNSRLKDISDRRRPNGSDTQSFPSGHTSAAAVHMRLASENMHALDLAPGVTRALDIGFYALTIGTSWSRIEAGYHYPSDTLVGMALGHFLASFVNGAFLGNDAPVQVAFHAADGGGLLSVSVPLR